MKLWIKRNLKKTLFVIVGATVLLGGLSACGHHQGERSWQMSEEKSAEFRVKMIEKVSSKLDLNAEQKQRLSTLTDKLQAQRKAVMGSTNPRAEMQALVAGPKFDRAKASALIEEKTSAVQLKSPEVIAAMADFYDSLNPAQQQKVRDFMQHRHGPFGRG